MSQWSSFKILVVGTLPPEHEQDREKDVKHADPPVRKTVLGEVGSKRKPPVAYASVLPANGVVVTSPNTRPSISRGTACRICQATTKSDPAAAAAPFNDRPRDPATHGWFAHPR